MTPIVSVIIATYNSAHFIVETLDSVYCQTYSDVELVVSDDCSSDDTVAICRDWMASHQGRFTRALLVENDNNIGIAGNYNRALRQATGEWVKTLDSDDRLLPSCIADSINASMNDPSINAWFFGWENIEQNGEVVSREPNIFRTMPARRQLRSYLVHQCNLHSNTMFIRRKTINDAGGFDPRFPMTQDIPLVYKLLVDGVQMGIVPEVYTIQFRNVPTSVSRSGNERMAHDIAACRYHYSRYFLRYGLVLHWYNAFVTHFIDSHHDKASIYRPIGYILRCLDILHLWRKSKSL